MSGYLVLIVTCILCGIVAAVFAKQKGRDPVMWFFIGAFTNMIVFVIIANLPRAKRTIS